jgi:hypothetical protein
MDAQEAWDGSKSDGGSKTITSYLQRFGIYIFLISFACVYYLSNAPLLLGHYDLGWHLAAGDLIRDQGNVPFQDPWSFTSAGRQWYNLSWLWDVIASVLFQYARFSGLTLFVVACGAVIVGYLTSPSEPLERRWNPDLLHARRHTPCSWMVGQLPLIRMTYYATISSCRNQRLMKPPGTRCLRNTRSIRCFG